MKNAEKILVTGGTGKTGRRVMTLIFIAALGALVLLVGCSGLNKVGDTIERSTAAVVSLDPKDANSYRSFALELEKTIARKPRLDPETQLYVEEVKPNLFYVTGGVYQSAFLKTGAGVIVFDAPPSFGHKLPEVIKQHAPNEAIKYLVYSHGHADHVGGASAFSDIQGLQVVAPTEVAGSIKEGGNPGILLTLPRS